MSKKVQNSVRKPQVAETKEVVSAAKEEIKNLPAVAEMPQRPDPEAIPLKRVAEEQPQPEVAQPEGVIPNCAQAKSNKAKPKADMLRVIEWIGEHPGKSLRIKRWHLYRKGMTLQHCKETEGLDHLDVLFYVENELMRLRPATKAEIEAVDKEWQKGNTEEKAA